MKRRPPAAGATGFAATGPAATAAAFFLVLAVSGAPPLSAQSVTSPAAPTAVAPARDYAAEVLLDRWDMNQRTDLGWRIFNTVELPLSNLTNISFAGGLFSADTTAEDVNISILDSSYAGSAMQVGKFGKAFPVNADTYTVFAVRMYVGPGAEVHPMYWQAFLYWSKDTIYNDTTWAKNWRVYEGWATYIINIPAMVPLGGSALPWSGTVDSLRFDPFSISGRNVKIDWIRLVQNTGGLKTVSWTGFGGNVDIYLDDDANAGNGNLGLLAKDQAGPNYQFLADALAYGTYYLAIAPTGTTSYVYSPGYYAVGEQPIVRIDKPSAEGSDQDYVTVNWSDPWDMANAADVEVAENVTGGAFTTVDYQDLAGTAFTNRTVFAANAAVAPPGEWGDPIVRLLHFWPPTRRGAVIPVDTVKYHNLVVKMGVWGTHDTAGGSIARIVWRLTTELVENVSQDIVIRHLPGQWVMDKIVCDLKTLPLEDGAGSPSHTGWTGMADVFRVDPHEFPDGRAFFIDDVKLTADWRADSSFQVTGAFFDSDSPATMSLFYDTDRTGYDGTLIAGGIAVGAGGGAPPGGAMTAAGVAGGAGAARVAADGSWSYTWTTSGVPNGTYYLYAVVDDGVTQNRAYATGPVVIQHSPGGIPTISLSKKQFYFGAPLNGTATTAEDVVLTNTGTGTLNWTATPSADWVSVSPPSGTGNAVLQLGIARTDMGAGTYNGTVTVADPNASNSPQVIQVQLVIYEGGDGAPFGSFDTPADGATVRSSIPVTGWALDDIQVVSVKIYRNPMPGEPTQPNGLVFIGNAFFVKGARLDIRAAFPTWPKSDRGGWGYMMLTNFLPNQGNGTFVIHAIATDSSGQTTPLGTKTITCDNLSAVKPFGAIDTPTQGGTATGSLFYNFGWALTPLPKFIPVDGSTIGVFVDGASLGNPNYGNYRVDIATLFPGYLNSTTGVGVFNLDTTGFSNGLHNIAWGVTDSGGYADGIGSRFFNILNLGAPPPQTEIEIRGQLTYLSVIGQISELSPIYIRRGFDLRAPAEVVGPERDGVVRLNVREVERIEVHLGPEHLEASVEEQAARGRALLERRIPTARARYSAYLVVGGELEPLPAGSTFDPERGVFYWMPGPGFLGEFTFAFVRWEGGRAFGRKTLKVKIGPPSPFE